MAPPKDPAQRRLRRPALAVLVICAIGAATAVVLLLSGQFNDSTVSRVSANLTQAGDTLFTPSAQANGGISPVCGCLETKINQWRGVTFAGREVTLRRSGRAPITEWLASGANLSPIELTNGETRMTIETFEFDGSHFSPSWLRHGVETLKRHATNIAHRHFYAHQLKIITEGSLHVDITGPVPVGEWIPLPGGLVTLKTNEGPFPEDAPPIELQERYPRLIGLQSNDKIISQQGYPLGDFLGPNVMLWSRSELPFATDVFEESQRPSRKLLRAIRPLELARVKKRVFVAVVRGAGFSTRVATIPLQPNELDALVQNLVGAGTRQQQIDGFHWGGGDGGQLSMTVSHPLRPESYARVRRHVEATPERPVRYWRDLLLIAPKHQPPGIKANYLAFQERGPDAPESATGAHGEEFRLTLTPAAGPGTNYNHGYVSLKARYPPLPPNAGFNVFGPMKTLQIDAALGALTVAGNRVAIDTPSPVSFSALSDFQSTDRQSVVSIPMTTAPGTAHLEFSAVGTVNVDGHTYAGRSPSSEATDIGLEALGVLAALITVVGAAFGAFRHLPQRLRRS